MWIENETNFCILEDQKHLSFFLFIIFRTIECISSSLSTLKVKIRFLIEANIIARWTQVLDQVGRLVLYKIYTTKKNLLKVACSHPLVLCIRLRKKNDLNNLEYSNQELWESTGHYNECQGLLVWTLNFS